MVPASIRVLRYKSSLNWRRMRAREVAFFIGEAESKEAEQACFGVSSAGQGELRV
jgi:hypothetical protein